jgi:hypothetical protein
MAKKQLNLSGAKEMLLDEKPKLNLSGALGILKKNETLQPVAPIGTKPSKTGFEPFQTPEDTKSAIRESVNEFRGDNFGFLLNDISGGNEPFIGNTNRPSVLLTEDQKLRQEQKNIGERFKNTPLNVPTEFGKVANFVDAAKKVKDTLPQAPQFRRVGEIPKIQPTEMTEGQRLGESLTKGTADVRELITDKLTGKKTGLQKQLENAENAFRAYQGDEIANQAQGYIRPEETLKIKQELGFGERMSDAGTNFVNRLERFPYNTSLALGQTLTTLLGEDLGSNAYMQITRGGNAELHRMEAFDKLAKLDAETKYSKGIVDSIQDLDLVNIAGGVVDAVGSLVSTVVTSAPTAGLGLYGDMVGGGLYDFNSTKARRLGLTVDELYDTNQNEFFVPAIINGAAAKLEGIGLKGIKSAIMNNMSKGAGQKFALVGHGMNKEGVTEWLQTGMEVVNNSLAEGKPLPQAVEESVKTLFSKKGAESYLMGAIASGAAIGGGRILKGLFSDKSKKKASEAIQSIEQQQEELSNPELSNESRVFIFENIKNNVKQLVDSVDEDVDTAEGLSAEQRKNITILNDKISSLEVVANDPAASEETKSRALESIKGIQETIDDITSKKVEAPAIEQPTFDTEESIGEEIRESNRKFQAGEIDQATWEQEQKDLNKRAESVIPIPEEAEIGKPEEVVSEEKGEKMADVFHGGSVKDIQIASIDNPLYVSESESQSAAYAKGNQGKVAKFKVDKSKIANEDEVRDVINELGLKPKDESWSVDELNIYELIDPTFDTAMSSESINKLFKELEKRGYGGAEFLGMNIETLKNDINDIVIFNPKLATNVEQTKPTQDAIQKQTAGQVPVQPKAPVSKEVEQGKPEAKPEVVTEEGVKAEEVGGDAGVKEKVYYHGTAANFDEFEPNKTKSGAIPIKGAIFFSSNKKIAKAFADQAVQSGLSGEIFRVARENSINLNDFVKNENYKEERELSAKAQTAISNLFKQYGIDKKITNINELGAEYLKIRNKGEGIVKEITIKPTAKIKAITGVKDWKGILQKYSGTSSGELKNKYKNYDVLIFKDIKDYPLMQKPEELGENDNIVVLNKDVIVSKKQPTQEQTPAQQVEQLRADEQAELKTTIPNAEQYLTDGKVDRAKITDAKDLKKFDEIYDKYDRLITPLLPEKETAAPKQEAPKKAKSLPKPKVATRLAFKKAVDLFYDISGTEGSAKKRTLAAKRKVFLEQNPSIKYIDDNWKDISKQLEAKGLITKKGNCP